MKLGDLVSWKGKTCIVAEIYESKCWRTDVFGNKIDWNEVEPELHARIIVGGHLFGVPAVDLELVGEGR